MLWARIRDHVQEILLVGEHPVLWSDIEINIQSGQHGGQPFLRGLVVFETRDGAMLAPFPQEVLGHVVLPAVDC
jgi:hypothetical protein